MSDSVLIRPVKVEDFQFIRDLAGEQENFTIPPPYVLWMLLKAKDDLCLVATSSSGTPLAYLLAIQIDTPPQSIYVWQLASTGGGKSAAATEFLLLGLRTFTKARQIEHIVFSATPGSASFKLIGKYCEQVFKATPRSLGILPRIVAPDEHEYILDL
jgi:hypothetical protein